MSFARVEGTGLGRRAGRHRGRVRDHGLGQGPPDRGRTADECAAGRGDRQRHVPEEKQVNDQRLQRDRTPGLASEIEQRASPAAGSRPRQSRHRARRRRSPTSKVGDHLRFGPKAVGAAWLVRAYFLDKAEDEFDKKRKGDKVDVILGAKFQQLATMTEVNQSHRRAGQAGAAAGHLRRGLSLPRPPQACLGPCRLPGRLTGRCRRPARPAGRAGACAGPAGPPPPCRRRAAAPQAGDQQARLGRDQAAGGVVPRVEALLVVRVQAALGREAQVERGRAEAADVADLGRSGRRARRPGAPAAAGVVAEAGGRPAPGPGRSRSEPVSRRPVAPGAAAAGRRSTPRRWRRCGPPRPRPRPSTSAASDTAYCGRPYR